MEFKLNYKMLLRALSTNGLVNPGDSDETICNKIQKVGEEIKHAKMLFEIVGDYANSLGITSLSQQVNKGKTDD